MVMSKEMINSTPVIDSNFNIEKSEIFSIAMTIFFSSFFLDYWSANLVKKMNNLLKETANVDDI